jgi:hypothetical protein
MNEALHNNNEPVISASQGWQEMQALLNTYLPVKRPVNYRRLILHYTIAALIFLVLLLTGLQLDQNTLPTVNHLTNAAAIKTIINPGSPSIAEQNTATRHSYHKPNALNSYAANHETRAGFIRDTVSAADLPYLQKLPAGIAFIRFATPALAGATIELPARNAGPLDLKEPKVANKKLKSGRLDSWSLFGGAGVNVSLHNSQRLQPYPVAEVRYTISPQIYLAAGLSAWSMVSTKPAGVSKTVFINDTVNNIRLYNETTTYKDLKYVDIPLSVGVKIAKNLSLQAGVQVSLMQSSKTERVLSPYDFQMNTVNTPVNSPVATFGPGMQQVYDVKMNRVDYRLTGGIRYQLNRAVFGADYQHALQSAGGGAHTSKERNHLVSVRVLFQLK